MINQRGDASSPINLNCGEVNLRWQDGRWINHNLDEQPNNPTPSLQDVALLQKENSQLQVECEILLHLLTISEMEKTKAKNKLQDLKSRISELLQKLENRENDTI